MEYSFQLYSAREFVPWDGVLAQLARIGYARVEGYGGLFEQAAEIRAIMDREGLTMPSSHFGLAMLENEFERAMSIAETLGVDTVICPHLPPDQRPGDRRGWRAVAERLARIGERVAAGGRRFAWHNHDFEFAPLADGDVPMQLLLDGAPAMEWEADIAWVIRGGAAPGEWIDRHAGRITLVHVKDIAADGECLDEDGWADVGHGTVDWPALLRQLERSGKVRHYVMEHDRPSDLRRFAERSLASARAFGI